MRGPGPPFNVQGTNNTVQGSHHGPERMHYSFGLSRGTRCVDDHSQIICRSAGLSLQWRCIRRDIVPFRVVRRWREWECNAGKVVRDTRLNLLPGIQLSNEKQFCFGVGKHIGRGFCIYGRVQSNRGVASHPNRDFSDEEMSAVLADNGNVAARLESHALDVRSHRARFLEGLLPCVVLDQTTTDRLG